MFTLSGSVQDARAQAPTETPSNSGMTAWANEGGSTNRLPGSSVLTRTSTQLPVAGGLPRHAVRFDAGGGHGSSTSALPHTISRWVTPSEEFSSA
jgi:hypothetical protein